jgi:alpha-tubulin suppressor-like RCC1 family protein
MWKTLLTFLWDATTQLWLTVGVSDPGKGNLFTLGVGCSGALGNGTESTWRPKSVNFFEHSNSIRSIDCGSSHTIVCTKDGEVYTWGLDLAEQCGIIKNPIRVDFQGQAINHVAAGDTFSMAVAEGGHKVYVWGAFKSIDALPLKNPVEATAITDLLAHHHTTIRKLKVSAHGVAFLTESGQLFVWGDNKFGQLANNHMRGRLILP